MNDVYAIFVDMMGFADGLEQLNPAEHEELEQRFMYSEDEPQTSNNRSSWAYLSQSETFCRFDQVVHRIKCSP